MKMKLNFLHPFFVKKRAENAQMKRDERLLNPEKTLTRCAETNETSRKHLKLVREMKKLDNLKLLVIEIDDMVNQLGRMRKTVRLLKNLRSSEL